MTDTSICTRLRSFVVSRAVFGEQAGDSCAYGGNYERFECIHIQAQALNRAQCFDEVGAREGIRRALEEERMRGVEEDLVVQSLSNDNGAGHSFMLSRRSFRVYLIIIIMRTRSERGAAAF